MHIKIFCALKSNGNKEMGILHIYIKLENTRRVKTLTSWQYNIINIIKHYN